MTRILGTLSPAAGQRKGLFGFVCWLQPEPAPAGSGKKFLSIRESVERSLPQPDAADHGQDFRWQPVSYSSGGRRFLGFINR